MCDDPYLGQPASRLLALTRRSYMRRSGRMPPARLARRGRATWPANRAGESMPRTKPPRRSSSARTSSPFPSGAPLCAAPSRHVTSRRHGVSLSRSVVDHRRARSHELKGQTKLPSDSLSN
jgi:hypothetical protein